MLKKLCLSATFAALSFVSAKASIDRITDIKNSIAHIAQEKTNIIAEKEMVASINKNSKKWIKEEACGHMMDFLSYQSEKDKIKSILNPITSSNEFISTINYLTDFQVTCIVNKHIAYNDIEYTPESYPLEQEALIQKTNDAVSQAFPTRDEKTELHFNIYYLQATQHTGYKLLLEKLELKNLELITELVALEAVNQTISE